MEQTNAFQESDLIREFPSKINQSTPLEPQVDEANQPREINPGVRILQFESFSRSNAIEKLNANIADNYVFVFNLENSVRFFVDDIKSSLLAKFNSLVHYGKGETLSFKLKENKKYHFTIICVESRIVRSLINNCKQEDFSEFIKPQELSYIGGSNLKVLDYLQKINSTGKETLSEMEIAGNIFMMLNSLIKQFIQEEEEKKLVKSSLKNWEIAELEKISSQIRQNPEYPYSVSGLSKKTGVSIPRLQEGFKEMHGLTVSLFIREARLQKAEQLIRNFDYTISEIVYSIGLNSRSYFSRIFKERFKVSPSVYQKKFSLKEM